MPPRYSLRCLGPPELRGADGAPIRFRTRKHLALLVFLAVEPRVAHRRDRLVDLLWGGAPAAEGRHSLATALSVLRTRIGPRSFESTRDTVRLVAPELRVDLERLVRGEVLGDGDTPPLEMGGFLDDFELRRAPEFMLWRDLMRARWLPAIREAFILLLDRCRRTGDFAGIEPLADRLLSLDGLIEEAIRAKMEARAFAGDRLTALRIFRGWKAQLAEELGAAPSQLLEGMALRLRQRGYEPPGTAHIPTVPTDHWRGTTFVGRGPHYRVVYELWERTLKRTARHALVLGDSGIGKTTLVERLVTAAGLEGGVASRVQCYEVEREIPYAAMGTLVRGLLERPGASATPPEWLAELARVIPAVRDHYPHLPPPPESEGEMARLRLAEGLHQLATAVAEEHPLILVVDDVHLADDASVAVLHLLMRRTQAQRIMVILTARQAELARSPHAGRLMESRRTLGLDPLELGPLTDDEMVTVVTALAAERQRMLSPAVRRALVRASAGVPMVAELLFDDWALHGEQCLALRVGAMTVDTLDQGQGVSDVYQQILERVFRDLSPPARAVLNLAAILSERLNDLAMYQLVDLSLAQTLAGMAELTGLRILRDGGRALEFRNEFLRGHAYLNVPSPLRRALHGLIADRLLLAESEGEKVPGLMLAWHCFRAGRPDQAVPYLLAGAEESIDQGGAFVAELALTSGRGSLGGASLESGTLLLARALHEQCRWQESIDVIAKAPQTEHTQSTARTLSLLVNQAFLAGTSNEAGSCLSQLRVFVQGAPPIDQAVLALGSAQELALLLGDEEGARWVRSTAEEIRGSVQELHQKIILFPTLLTAEWMVGSRIELRKTLEEVSVLRADSRRTGLASSQVLRLLNIAGCACTAIGEYEMSIHYFEEGLAVAKRLEHIDCQVRLAGNLAMSHCRLGNYSEQIRWGERALGLHPRAADHWPTIRSALWLSWGYSLTGENAKAMEVLLGRAGGERLESSRPWQVQAHRLLSADILWASGEMKRAMRLALEAVELWGLVPLSKSYVGLLARWAARTAEQRKNISATRTALALFSQDAVGIDVWDQLEVLAAENWLVFAEGAEGIANESRLADWFDRFPSARHQMSRLGLYR